MSWSERAWYLLFNDMSLYLPLSSLNFVTSRILSCHSRIDLSVKTVVRSTTTALFAQSLKFAHPTKGTKNKLDCSVFCLIYWEGSYRKSHAVCSEISRMLKVSNPM